MLVVAEVEDMVLMLEEEMAHVVEAEDIIVVVEMFMVVEEDMETVQILLDQQDWLQVAEEKAHITKEGLESALYNITLNRGNYSYDSSS